MGKTRTDFSKYKKLSSSSIKPSTSTKPMIIETTVVTPEQKKFMIINDEEFLNTIENEVNDIKIKELKKKYISDTKMLDTSIQSIIEPYIKSEYIKVYDSSINKTPIAKPEQQSMIKSVSIQKPVNKMPITQPQSMIKSVSVQQSVNKMLIAQSQSQKQLVVETKTITLDTKKKKKKEIIKEPKTKQKRYYSKEYIMLRTIGEGFMRVNPNDYNRLSHGTYITYTVYYPEHRGYTIVNSRRLIENKAPNYFIFNGYGSDGNYMRVINQNIDIYIRDRYMTLMSRIYHSVYSDVINKLHKKELVVINTDAYNKLINKCEKKKLEYNKTRNDQKELREDYDELLMDKSLMESKYIEIKGEYKKLAMEYKKLSEAYIALVGLMNAK